MAIKRDEEEDEKERDLNDPRLQNPLTMELEKLSQEIQIEVERLNHEYNKFFGGAEQRPPIKLRQQMDKKAERLKTIMRNSPNLGTTMRVQNAVNKYNTYIAMWDKRLLQIEQAGKG